MSDPRTLDTAAYDAMRRQVGRAIAERDANFATMSAAAITAVLSSLAYNWPLRPGRNAPAAPEPPQEHDYLTRRDLMELADQAERKNLR